MHRLESSYIFRQKQMPTTYPYVWTVSLDTEYIYESKTKRKELASRYSILHSVLRMTETSPYKPPDASGPSSRSRSSNYEVVQKTAIVLHGTRVCSNKDNLKQFNLIVIPRYDRLTQILCSCQHSTAPWCSGPLFN